MSDMHDTRRFHGGGVERGPDVAKPALAPVSPQSVWDVEDRRKLWRQVTNLEKELEGNMTFSIVTSLSFAIVVCVAMILLVWRQQANFDERLANQQKFNEAYKDAIDRQFVFAANEVYRAMKKQEQELRLALERLAAVNENPKAAVAARMPAVTLEDITNRTLQDNCYRGWSVAQMFDDLEVIHLHWDREMNKRHDILWDAWPIPDEVDLYIHLERVLYECAKRQQRQCGTYWPELRAQLARFVDAAQGKPTSSEIIRNLAHCSIVEYYDAERVIGVANHQRRSDDDYFRQLAADHTFYLHLDDEAYASAKSMKTLDVQVLEDAHHNR